MVTGLDRWREYFGEYKDKYVLIGGAACNLLEEELCESAEEAHDLVWDYIADNICDYYPPKTIILDNLRTEEEK